MQFRTEHARFFLSIMLCLGVCQNISAQTGAPRSLNVIRTQAEFDLLAVTYDQNTPYALPHLLFVIDRKDKNKIYYVNTKKYAFHKDFVNEIICRSNAARSFSKTTI